MQSVPQAEADHWRQWRTARLPARLLALEIAKSTQKEPLQYSALSTREETRERESLFDMEFSQPKCRDRARRLPLYLGRIKSFHLGHYRPSRARFCKRANY